MSTGTNMGYYTIGVAFLTGAVRLQMSRDKKEAKGKLGMIFFLLQLVYFGLLSKAVTEYNELNKACEEAEAKIEAKKSENTASTTDSAIEDDDGTENDPENEGKPKADDSTIEFDLDGDGKMESISLDSCLADKCKYIHLIKYFS